MIVLSVSDPGHVMRRQFQQGQRRFEATGLADTGGKYHNGAFVANDLECEPELADGLQHCLLVRLPGRNDGASDRYGHRARVQPINKRLWRLWREQRFLAGLWIEKEAAILSDNQIEERNLGKNFF